MADEKERTTHYDERESELQQSKEIQDLSEEVMQLIQQDEEAPPLLGRTASAPVQVRVPPSQLLGTRSQFLSGQSEPTLGVGQRMSSMADPDEELNAAKQHAVNGADSTTSESTFQPGAYRVTRGVARQRSLPMADISSQEFTTQSNDDESKETESPDENSTSDDGAMRNQQEETESEDPGNLRPTLHSSQDQNEESLAASARSVGESSLTVVAVRVDPGEAEQLAIRRILDEAVQADVVAQESPVKWWSNKKRRTIVVAAFLLVIGLVVGLSVTLAQNAAGNTGENHVGPSQEQPPFQPTLQTVRERGVLRCGSPDVFYHINVDPETGERVGFEIDMVS